MPPKIEALLTTTEKASAYFHGNKLTCALFLHTGRKDDAALKWLTDQGLSPSCAFEVYEGVGKNFSGINKRNGFACAAAIRATIARHHPELTVPKSGDNS